MRSKKPKVLYDPNAIWACSVDLRESKPQELKLDTQIKVEDILPKSPQPDLDNPEQTKIN